VELSKGHVLVTGGNGFIGQYVFKELVAQGYEPWVFDRRFEAMGRHTILGDIRDAAAVTEAVAHADGVIHLAGVLGTQETITNPVPAAETNILGGLNVLQACAQYGVPLVNIGVGNWFENNTYSLTKHCVERFVQMFSSYRALRCCTVRALNAYGPGQAVATPHGPAKVRKVIPSFVSRALHGEPLQVYGSGAQVMDMIHVRDVARALAGALGYLLGGGQPGIQFSAGTGRRTTVKYIAEAVEAEVFRQTGRHTLVERLPMRPGETPDGVVLGEPSTLVPLGVTTESLTPLEVGLEETVRWYRRHFGDLT
jgi:nucleoside-diphosphate-sugar epimerase